MALIDSLGRTIDYLRIGLIDRCNLRCSYCMPERGLNWIPGEQLLSDSEILRLLRITSHLGVTKVRFTGGEPMIRKNVMALFQSVSDEKLFKEWSMTTNGVTTHRYLHELQSLGLQSINLSLDSLNHERFHQITRRDQLNDVLQTLHGGLDLGIRVKVNMVVQMGINDQDIASMSALAVEYPIDVRFIEEMPFNGGERKLDAWCDAPSILKKLRSIYPDLSAVPPSRGETAQSYSSPILKGSLGIIAAWSRSFCGTCNRLRITPDGKLKTCLYASGGISLREHMRHNMTDDQLAEVIQKAVRHKFANGHEAERVSGKSTDSMATIGG